MTLAYDQQKLEVANVLFAKAWDALPPDYTPGLKATAMAKVIALGALATGNPYVALLEFKTSLDLQFEALRKALKKDAL